MKLLAAQKNSTGFSDYYHLIFVHKDVLFFAETDSNDDMDEIVKEVISIDEDIDFDNLKVWLKEWMDPADYTPFYKIYGWEDEMNSLLKSYIEDNPIQANHVSE